MHIGVIIVLPLLHFKPFVTKFGMVVHFCEAECYATLTNNHTQCEQNGLVYGILTITVTKQGVFSHAR